MLPYSIFLDGKNHVYGCIGVFRNQGSLFLFVLYFSHSIPNENDGMKFQVEKKAFKFGGN